MGSAIAIGQTGLSASSKQMEVIGNNLANTNTVGFKASSTQFRQYDESGVVKCRNLRLPDRVSKSSACRPSSYRGL